MGGCLPPVRCGVACHRWFRAAVSLRLRVVCCLAAGGGPRAALVGCVAVLVSICCAHRTGSLVAAQLQPVQTAALVDLYNATGGPNWHSTCGAGVGNGNWLVGDPCQNSWAGVTCSGSDVVYVAHCVLSCTLSRAAVCTPLCMHPPPLCAVLYDRVPHQVPKLFVQRPDGHPALIVWSLDRPGVRVVTLSTLLGLPAPPPCPCPRPPQPPTPAPHPLLTAHELRTADLSLNALSGTLPVALSSLVSLQ
jgi:hypothetical protein